MLKQVRVLILAGVCLTASATGLASGLPPEHEAARLMLSVKQLVEERDWERAGSQLAKMQSLDVTLDEDYYYLNGRVLRELGQQAEAVSHLEQYVIKAGNEGRYYNEALSLITLIEEQSVSAPLPVAPVDPIQPELKSADDGYIKSLQALYLTTDPVAALVQQVNSLLSAHAYTGKRVKTAEGREGIQYSISVNNRELLVQKKSYQRGQPLLEVDKLNVLGIDPFVEYGCSERLYECYLYHPSRKSEKWLRVDRDQLVASELSQAVSKLIRLLQQ